MANFFDLLFSLYPRQFIYNIRSLRTLCPDANNGTECPACPKVFICFELSAIALKLKVVHIFFMQLPGHCQIAELH